MNMCRYDHSFRLYHEVTSTLKGYHDLYNSNIFREWTYNDGPLLLCHHKATGAYKAKYTSPRINISTEILKKKNDY